MVFLQLLVHHVVSTLSCYYTTQMTMAKQMQTRYVPMQLSHMQGVYDAVAFHQLRVPIVCRNLEILHLILVLNVGIPFAAGVNKQETPH